MTVQDVGGDVAHVDSSDAHAPALRVRETGDQGGEGGLTRPGGTDEGGHASFGHRQAHIIQGERAPVGEGDGVDVDAGATRLLGPTARQRWDRQQGDDAQGGGPGDLVGPRGRSQHLDRRRNNEGDDRASDHLDGTDHAGGRERRAPGGRDEEDQRGGDRRLAERRPGQERAAPGEVEAGEVLGGLREAPV